MRSWTSSRSGLQRSDPCRSTTWMRLMFGRWIPGNKSSDQPSAIVIVDCESEPHQVAGCPGETKHTLRLGVATYFRWEAGKATRCKTIRFHTALTFWQWLNKVSSPSRPTWVWCHNAAADLPWLNLHLMMETSPPAFCVDPSQWPPPTGGPAAPKGWKGFVCLNDPPTFLRVRSATGWVMNLVDLMNFLPVSLRAIGEWVGLNKLDMPAFDQEDDVWFDYCERDVEITKRAVIKLLTWIKVEDLGMFRWTLASQSLAAWRHKHREIPIAPHHHPQVDRLERDGYFGGQADLRFRGVVKPPPAKRGRQKLLVVDSPDQVCYGPIHELDCTSLYPWLYTQVTVPTVLVDFAVPDSRGRIRGTTLASDCMAQVLVHAQTDPYPLRCDGGVVWPVGKFWTTLCGSELARAVKCRDVMEVGRWARYECKLALRSFGLASLERRAQARAAGDLLQEKLEKMLANSLHGKFGQNPVEWSACADQYVDDPWTQWTAVSPRTGTYTRYRAVGYDVQVKGVADAPSHQFTAIPAWICSAAREHLRRLAAIAGRWQCLYCHADSLYVTSLGLERLTRAGEIADRTPGKLRLVRSGNDADFSTIGDLRLGAYWKKAGVPRSHLADQPPPAQWQQWDGLETTLFGSQPSVVRTVTRQKAPASEWWRGEVMHTGWIERLTLAPAGQRPPELGSAYPLPHHATRSPMRPVT